MQIWKTISFFLKTLKSFSLSSNWGKPVSFNPNTQKLLLGTSKKTPCMTSISKFQVNKFD